MRTSSRKTVSHWQSGELNQANLTNAAGYTAVGLQKNTDGSVAGGTLVVESSTLSYNGPTTVNAGTVEFDDSASLSPARRHFPWWILRN